MSNEQLTAYLKDESYLYSLSYEELKTLVVEYPYASNLRILLLKKSYIDKNKDYERNLQMAAAYTTNRRHLYKIVQTLKTLQNAPENVILGEDYLELTELSNIEKMLQERHVSEVFNEKKAHSDTKSSVQWSGIEFEDAENTFSSGSASDYSKFDSSEGSNLSEAFEFSEPLELNILKGADIKAFEQSSESHVDLAIESIMAEFGSLALDLTGNGVSLNINLGENDRVSDSITFENDEIQDAETLLLREEPELEAFMEIPNEIPQEPLTFEKKDVDLLSVSLENEKEIEEKDVHYFEELENKSELIEETNAHYLQNNTNSQVLDFESLDSKSINDFQDNDAIIENVLLETPQSAHLSDMLKATFSSVESESQLEINMKKRDIEIEIVNNSKAKVIESEPTKDENVPAVSFTEWLRQFKVATPKLQNVEALVVQKEKKSVEITSKITEPTEIKHVLKESVVALLFETPSELPDNLFGFNSLKSTKKASENLDFEDSSDELEDVFAVKKKKKKKQMHELAARSIEENNDLMSETLADLLAWQGNNKKAIEMYTKLCLQIPEKSDYFAAKIEKLRNID
jgi:hypothetical protein